MFPIGTGNEFRRLKCGQSVWRIQWTDVVKRGLLAWVLRPFMFACYWLQLAQHKAKEMPLQITTAFFTLLFAALLMLSSHRFLDGRAANLNSAVATRAAVTQIAPLP